MKIQGCHFLVTGANRGIGLAVARMAAREGAHLHLVCRIQGADEAELLTLGAKSVSVYVCDLSRREDLEQLIPRLDSIPIDILFNNAGLLTGGLLEDQALDEIYALFQVNVLALIHLTRALVPGMIKRGRGKIINNASVSAFMHFPCASTYAASKAAVVAFTNGLDSELKGTGVNTLCLITPGIKTRMFDEIEGKYAKHIEVPMESLSPEEYAEQIRSHILKDKAYLFPKGSTALGLWISRHLPGLFKMETQRRFRR